MRLSEYLWDCIFPLLCMLVSSLLLFGLLWLMETPAVFILFAEIILIGAYLIALLYDFFRKKSYYNLLLRMLEQMDEKTLLDEMVMQPHFLEGQLLADILRRCNKYQNDRICDAKQESREYREYIDSWVHEIKTPITSARLMIENEKNPTTLRIDDELRKIDAYVEQVLYYARSTDVEKDFKAEKTTLQSLVYAALKTYSKPLIQAGGKPVLEGLDIPIVADCKSCSFVIGQILSNAIKYRKENLQIHFYAKVEKNNVLLFSFSVHKGEFLGLMGSSGSGKTTLLNCVSTIDTVTSGHIYVEGEDITTLYGSQLADFRGKKLGFIFQDFNLLDTLTAYENIALALSIAGEKPCEIQKRVPRIAEALNIQKELNKYPYQMSGGQKQRVAAARAMITNPAIVLADEPTGALDSHSSRMLLSLLTELNEQLKATILMVTHDAFSASYCHRILFIKDGQVFNELRKGADTRKAFFTKILDVVSVLGGEKNDLM